MSMLNLIVAFIFILGAGNELRSAGSGSTKARLFAVAVALILLFAAAGSTRDAIRILISEAM